MGQYYKIVNVDKKQSISPCYGFKAMETFHNDGEFYGQAMLILFHDTSCIEQGGGDIRFSTLKLTKAQTELIGSWVGDKVIFVGDYTDTEYYNLEVRDITNILIKIIEKINL